MDTMPVPVQRSRRGLFISSMMFLQFATLVAMNAAHSVTTCTGGNNSCSLASPSASYPAFTAPFPLVIRNTVPPVSFGAYTPPSIIANPQIIPVFFSDSPDQPATVAFLQALVASKEWAVLSEYGVGAASVGAPVYLTTAAPATVTTMDAANFVGANAASWATLDGSQIFSLFYPPSTVGTSIPGYPWPGNAFHTFAVTPTDQPVIFTVVINWAIGGATNQFHELAEASTDPFFASGDGYWLLSHDNTTWRAITVDTEVADMCEIAGVFLDSDLPLPVQAIYSDTAVTNGMFPCTSPGSQLTPFGAYPVLPDTYTDGLGPNASLKIAPGASATIAVNLYSYAALTAPITVSVQQSNINAAKTNVLTFSFDQTTGINGSVVNLTITAPSTPLSDTTVYASFLIQARVASAVNAVSGYPGLVTN
jgi:hypothetical protein